jgi:uncharacterized protein (DUF1501 family)
MAAFSAAISSFPDPTNYAYGDVNAVYNVPIASVRAVQLGLAAFKTGVTSAFSMAMGNFDSHEGNDNGQRTVLMRQWATLNYLLDSANGIDPVSGARNSNPQLPVVILVASDFGRTPEYTGSRNDGTDHWSIGSAMVLYSDAVAAKYRIGGGATTGGLTIGTSSADYKTGSYNGTRFQPSDVIKLIRLKLGIDTSPAIAQYPIICNNVLGSLA